ncbi:nucleoside hydrolase [Micromonospora sp. DT31]|uniref:nucleoside hydrolase n=1 Tax=Micromonospora sp. DT31 TaxID=3393434 RepID=UPI003CF305A4
MAKASDEIRPDRRPWLRALAAMSVLVTFAAGLVAWPAPAQATHSTPRVIIDTDFGQWWDDVAALAAAHAAADAGQVRLLGVMTDVDNRWNAPAIDALNTWYGRPDLPVGAPVGAPQVPEAYSRLLAERWPHSGRAVDAVTLYRRLLAAQPDHSVTIVAIGALTNLSRLLRTDRELVARKVARTVVMGGEYPRATAPEWNFGLDLDATRRVVDGWPGRVVYDGFEVGAKVFVGNGVCAAHRRDSPVRAVFDLLYGCGADQRDGTWDPAAVHYAIHGPTGTLRDAGAGGHNTVTADGLNRWQPGGHRQRYLVLTDPARLTRQIDAYVNRRPHR